MMDLFTFKSDMLTLLQTVGIVHREYTLAQAFQCLKVYLLNKKLLCNPTTIVLEDDPLKNLLSCPKFDLTINEHRTSLKRLFAEHLIPCGAAPGNGSASGQGLKRKYSSTDNEEQKPRSPVYINIPTIPTYDSGEETSYSTQDYATEEARNSGSSSDSDTDISIDLPRINFTMERLADSGIDVPFWADSSDDCGIGSSVELKQTKTEVWQCIKCGLMQRGDRIRCLQCRYNRRTKKKKILTRKERCILQQAQDAAKERRLNSSQESCEGSEAEDKCIICVNTAANALILHGQTAHNICCYRCARKLQKESLPNTCPACRRSIDRVVRLLNHKINV